MNRDHANTSGFTLMELLVVMTIIALLLTLAVPRYFHSIEKSKETVLHDDLSILRESLDKFFSDNGKYPDSLDELVAKKYLRGIPRDPITESTSTWVTIPPDDPSKGLIYDIRSGAPDKALDGTNYAEW